MQKRNDHQAIHLPQALIVVGVILLVVVILMMKDRSQPTTTAGSSSALPEAQLQRSLDAGKPVLAFYHSNNCEQCIIMIDTVKQVYPEFAGSVVLVDVNVYDENNGALLEREKVQYIPTLVFYDHNGDRQTTVGVLEADDLRQRLSSLSEKQ